MSKYNCPNCNRHNTGPHPEYVPYYFCADCETMFDIGPQNKKPSTYEQARDAAADAYIDSCDNESGSFLQHQLEAIRRKAYNKGRHEERTYAYTEDKVIADAISTLERIERLCSPKTEVTMPDYMKINSARIAAQEALAAFNKEKEKLK